MFQSQQINTMKTLTKPFIVIWDITTKIISLKMLDNIQTFISDDSETAEFNTNQELEDFIVENNLIEDSIAEN